MLKALYDYALRHDLALPPGYVSKTVKAYIALSTTSDYLGIVMGDDAPIPCPDIGSLANSKDKSNVIVEKRSVAIPDEPTAKSEFFRNALKSAAETEPMLNICADALLDPDRSRRIRSLLDENKIKASDRISFQVDGQPVVGLDAVKDWWQTYRRSFRNSDDKPQSICLITGSPTVPQTTTASIQGLRVVGGHASGDALICFDKAAFCSYGLKQGANAPVSETAFGAVKSALDKLLEDAPVLAGMKFVHWYDTDVEPEEDPILQSDNLFAGMADEDDGDEEEDETPSSLEQEQAERAARRKADRLVESVKTGERDVLLGNTNYHILLLTGVGGRVMIRRYEQGSYRQLKERLEQWNQDLELINPFGSGTIPSCKLTARLLRLLSYQKVDREPFKRLGKELAGITPSVLMSILSGTTLPDAVAVRSLQYIRSQMFLDEDETNRDRRLFEIGWACQWLKVWLVRNQKKGAVIMSEYNAQASDPAYQSGAMMAIYAAIQNAASPDVNVTVVQRYYASAIQTPALVIGRLSQLSVHHLGKIENRWLANYYKTLLEETSAKIEGPIPTVLRLEEQSAFALGYYQMSARLNQEKAQRIAAKKQQSD